MSTAAAVAKPEVIYRHSVLVRVTHWVNVLCLLVLLMSGLQIFNAHSTLYFGEKSDPDRAVLSMDAVQREDGSYAGVTTIGSTSFDTTGVLGLSRDGGELDARGVSVLDHAAVLSRPRDGAALAFLLRLAVRAERPRLPRLFACSAATCAATSRPRARSCATCRSRCGSTCGCSFPRGEAAKRYNVLQKLAYLAVIFVLLPLTILSGLTMSPAMDAAFPFLLDFFGGRQSARTVHFLCATGIVLFVLVHVAWCWCRACGTTCAR